MYRFFLFSLLLILFFACEENKGNRIEGEKIILFFDDKANFGTAKRIAEFWKENDFLGEKRQYLKLSKYGDVFYLSLIAEDKKSVHALSFYERKLLLELQKQIDSLLPKNHYSNIVLCDSNFEPLFNIND